MKKIFYSIILSVAVFSMVSCEQFLTVSPQDSLQAENYYTSKEAIRSNTQVLYASTPWFDFHNGFMFYSGDMMAGDMYYTYAEEGHYYYNSVMSTNSYLRGGWVSLYRIVSFANSIINDMPDAARANGVAEADIMAGCGEAWTMRAMAYFFLTELWGEVPIVENSTELITSSDATAIFVPRNTQESLYRFMVRDLEKAIPVLPSTDTYGHVTKTSAMGLLAKVYLQYAAYKKDAELYAKAAEWAKKAVEEGEANGYGLYDYEKLFTVEGNNNMESLIAIQCKSGAYAEGNAKNAAWSRSSRLADQTWGAGKGPSLSLQSLYKDGDIRRKATYMTNGDYYAELATEEGGYTYQYVYRNPEDLDVIVESSNEMLAHIKKYIIGKPADCGGNVGLNQDGGNNMYLLRFADVMMVYIEACIGTGNETSDATALEYMSRILARAGLTSDYASITFEDIIRERRIEFAMEGINWYDVKRVWYRDHAAGIAYLDGMDRDKKYVFNWSSDNFTYDAAGNATFTVEDQYAWENNKSNYVTIWESMDITNSNEDNSANKDYYMGAEWLEANGHRVKNISFSDASMYLPIPESELTTAPILGEPAVEYVFAE